MMFAYCTAYFTVSPGFFSTLKISRGEVFNFQPLLARSWWICHRRKKKRRSVNPCRLNEACDVKFNGCKNRKYACFRGNKWLIWDARNIGIGSKIVVDCNFASCLVFCFFSGYCSRLSRVSRMKLFIVCMTTEESLTAINFSVSSRKP